MGLFLFNSTRKGWSQCDLDSKHKGMQLNTIKYFIRYAIFCHSTALNNNDDDDDDEMMIKKIIENSFNQAHSCFCEWSKHSGSNQFQYITGYLLYRHYANLERMKGKVSLGEEKGLVSPYCIQCKRNCREATNWTGWRCRKKDFLEMDGQLLVEGEYENWPVMESVDILS